MRSDSNLTFIITARGGSKGLPGKNLRLLGGLPLIAWSIRFAQAQSSCPRIIVSTDSHEIATVSQDYGAEVPFIRQSELATCTASSSDVILDVINRCNIDDSDYFVLLEPTSPIRFLEDFDKLRSLVEGKKASKIVSVSRAVSTAAPFQYRVSPLESILESRVLDSGTKYLRRQDTDDFYYLDGTFYASSVLSFRQNPVFSEEGVHFLESNFFSSFEIDTLHDFVLHECITSHLGLPSWLSQLS